MLYPRFFPKGKATVGRVGEARVLQPFQRSVSSKSYHASDQEQYRETIENEVLARYKHSSVCLVEPMRSFYKDVLDPLTV